jgi:hypothetical protein
LKSAVVIAALFLYLARTTKALPIVWRTGKTSNMKRLLLLLTLISAIASHGQMSFSNRHVGPPGEFEKGAKERFKASTTIFVVPRPYTVAQYESILKDNWTASQYKVVAPSDFNIKDYLTEAYSFAWLRCDVIMDNKIFYPKIYFDVFMLENEKVAKKIDKALKDEDKLLDLIDDNKINFAQIPLMVSNHDFLEIKSKLNPTVRLVFSGVNPERKKDAFDYIFANKSLNNYEPGFLKNDFQRLNRLINEGKVYWMYGNDKKPEMKNLKKTTLYIPDYIKINIHPMSGKEEVLEDKDLTALLKPYKSKYEVVSQEVISQKILAGEDFYYFRYARVIASKFVEIVNGKTGEVIYRSYVGFAAYNLKDKDFAGLN